MTRVMRRERTAVVPHRAEWHPNAHLQKEGNQVQKARGKDKDMQVPNGRNRDINFSVCLSEAKRGRCLFNLQQRTKSWLS